MTHPLTDLQLSQKRWMGLGFKMGFFKSNSEFNGKQLFIEKGLDSAVQVVMGIFEEEYLETKENIETIRANEAPK